MCMGSRGEVDPRLTAKIHIPNFFCCSKGHVELHCGADKQFGEVLAE